jgi:hypothetical protein
MRPEGIEVGDIVRAYGSAFLDRFGAALAPEQRRALADIATCRTAALGGHVETCDSCDYELHAYNSCRNRHCPKCQAAARAIWLDAREAELLPVGYFHVVFILPAGLADLALRNPREIYRLLFSVTAEICWKSRPTRNTSARRSAFWRCCTPGARICSTIPTCTV